MSKKSIKHDIEFVLDGVEYSLTPMKQKVAANVFHNCLSHILAAVAQAISGSTEADKMALFAKALGEVATFDDVWFLLEHMMAHAMVDSKEIGKLDNSDIFEENPHHMYLVLFHGIKGNWPNYFSRMEAKMSGFASSLSATFDKMTQAPQGGQEQ